MSVVRWLALALTLVGSAGSTLSQEQQFRTILDQDFRGKRPLHPSLKIGGPDVDAVTKYEDGGLRITLAPTRALNYPIEVVTKFSLSGDFEITGTYELLSASQPTTGYGVGVSLNVATNEARDKFAKVGRVVLVKEGAVLVDDGNAYVTEYWSNLAASKVWNRKPFPTKTRSGQLRLLREGPIIHFLVSDAAGAEFHELHQWSFGTDDVANVRFAVTDSGAPGNSVDVRLVDLKIRSPSAATEQAVTAASTPAADGRGGSKKWLTGVLVVLGIVLASTLAVWLYVRSRRSDEATAVPVVDEAQLAEVVSATITVQCAGCGKNLKGKAELAGKRVKCPHCGTAVLVPGTQLSEPPQAPGRSR